MDNTKIIIHWAASKSKGVREIKLSDIGIVDVEEWNALTEQERENFIIDELDSMDECYAQLSSYDVKA